MLDDWLTDPRAAGQRGLCLGLFQDQDCYFNPTTPEEVYPNFAKLTGVTDFSSRTPASGKVEMQFVRFFGKAARHDVVSLQLPDNGEIGVFDFVTPPVESVLELDGKPVVVRNVVNGNPVYTCGFYLGMAYNAMWGIEKEQNPHNTLNPLYEGMLLLAGIEPSITAPDNLGVYVSDDNATILVKERFGKATEFDLGVKKLAGSIFDGTTVLHNADGSAVIKGVKVEPYGVTVLRKVAGISAAGISWEAKSLPSGGIDCALTGKGKVIVTFELAPKTIYSIHENGALIKVFTADDKGRHAMTFDLSAKPRRFLIQESKRK